ncbi:Probable lipoprotein precursor [Flavobacterium indicum GPTSA100-9 = DSM 17447]|uniref:Probable lipoprotein n=1 Tax=Flavobacterium indicum (strain DSM 17447 / CIP 109464 / GPTSA100-9) TaxID=1094466 RepID=H8XP05_FLAIG|nr:hypothetical protein [Flavobacterium indicum]CCG52272.1 Probable lipoprotein precursor [Flavobacterium indicum GPTSA100-9 = DSM 17447]
MKTLIYILSFITFTACDKDDNTTKDPTFSLPPETQTGANTFGVTINGKVYIPRDPTGVSVGPTAKGMIFWGAPDNVSWNEIEVVDGASNTGFQMIIHLQNLQSIGTSQYNLKQSNFHNQIDSTPNNHIYFKIWDGNINNYAYYGSVEDQGIINVFKFQGSLTQNWILSGNFSGKFVRYNNPNDFITITDGRFDLNLNTLPNHPFP